MTDTLNLTIKTGVRLTINDDPARVISFNPGDVVFAERFYGLIREFNARQSEYEARAEALDAVTDVDEQGLGVNIPDRIAFMRDVCEFMHAQIDALFGEGTSQAAFQGALDMDAIAQFFEGIAPFIQRSRDGKVEKYRKAKSSKVMR